MKEITSLTEHLKMMKLSVLNRELSQQNVYIDFKKLIELGATQKQISDIAFEYYNMWNTNSEKAQNAIYDLSLLGENGMENLEADVLKDIVEDIIN